ncbi:MAG: membrane integrity-associated transporter subunit PqiC [Robiginitomaculum sp.]|nr:membrane integrity-associated transporter subunit PqiC [Robiginitomaculum sp.]
MIFFRGSKTKLTQFTTLALSVTFLSACSVLPKPKPAPAVYRLTAPQSLQSQSVEQTKVVNIEMPTTSKALSGMDIILSPDGRRLTMASGAHWAQPVPSLLQNSLIDMLMGNPNVTGIIPKGNTRVPYRLNMDIRRFEAVFDAGENAPPLAIVHLNFPLRRAKQGS